MRKSWRQIKKEKRIERSMRGVEARRRKRSERAASMVDVGGIRTDGCMGEHTIRLLAWPNEDLHYAVVVDGEHRMARTYRGVLRCVSKMLYAKMEA